MLSRLYIRNDPNIGKTLHFMYTPSSIHVLSTILAQFWAQPFLKLMAEIMMNNYRYAE